MAVRPWMTTRIMTSKGGLARLIRIYGYGVGIPCSLQLEERGWHKQHGDYECNAGYADQRLAFNRVLRAAELLYFPGEGPEGRYGTGG